MMSRHSGVCVNSGVIVGTGGDVPVHYDYRGSRLPMAAYKQIVLEHLQGW